jgi:hypothetical protein
VNSLLKNLAGVLAGLLFGVAAAYAISGGPFQGSLNVVGTYAGVLKPSASPCPSVTVSPAPMCTPAISPCAANSLGIFSIGVPQSGLASGTFVMFAQGRVFTGSIQGAADAEKAKLTGVLTARYNFTVTGTPCPQCTPNPNVISPTPCPACTPSSQNITALANGSLKSRITTSSTQSAVFGATRLSGTSILDISNGTVLPPTFEQNVNCEIPMKVSGFKQSNTAPTSSTNPSSSP